MMRFRDMPFQRKLRVSMLLTSTLALLLACSLFLILEYLGHRRNLEHTAVTLARMSADNLTAAVAFDDPEAATDILNNLRAESQVVGAVVFDADGAVFASYSAEGYTIPVPSDGASAVEYRGEDVLAHFPIMERQRQLGTIYLAASTEQLQQRVRTLAFLMLSVLMASIAFAWFLSVILQRTLARPILELANTASSITARRDWSLRARRYGEDELGRLTDDFNSMLERTQKAVAALRESEADLRLVTDNVPVSLGRFDRELRVMFSNRPNAERMGRTPETVVGLHAREFLGEENFVVAQPYMEAALRGEHVVYEREFYYPKVGNRWVEVSYVPEPSPDAEPPSFVAIVTDITERRRVAEEAARARDEALAASRAKDDFLAALSHELRTPLNPVLLLASERASQKDIPEALRSDFDMIRHNVELEARLIDDLLDLTRITRGKLSIQKQRLDIRTVIDQAIAAVCTEITEKDLDFARRDRASDWIVEGDAVRLQQVLWNVLKNAVKFTPSGGRISMEIRNIPGSQTIEIIVSDTGIGMTADELSRVFAAFVQGDHVSKDGLHRFGGLGLGLAITRMLVELHEGEIHAASPGREAGATITIRLPLAPPEPSAGGDETEDEDELLELPQIPGEASKHFTQETAPILLVEDHVPTRMTLTAVLQARGYRVVGAGSVAEAMAAVNAAEGHFSLVISDIGLPDGDGCSLMHALRELIPGLRGIAVSGYGMEEDIARSSAAGFETHLTKPVSIADLNRVVPGMLASRK